ncbi:hypothetical protein [Christiangramia sp. SM2212]|uniref:Outer membrane protein beta-barrel domain-containing protein n=1 Tax=Christiangramia sediminicola TaxID=3073267 RepID=A0ABU1EM03_9FLAO|nr:hypothetical protein [Christiangramia sp. SM2212]MDR5589097.1 hypothetical protein [Christiangramia sp. SM2212]
MQKFKSYSCVLIFIILGIHETIGQTKESQNLNLSVGYGISAPYDETDIDGSGFFAQGEYIFDLKNWIDLRPYMGLFLTYENSDNELYKTTSKALLIGGKGRITAPIPWVAPYLELGIGASIGNFETITPLTNLSKNGVLMHIPFSLGLELGPKHNFDLSFTYFYHPAVEQFSGAIAFGISIPIKKA